METAEVFADDITINYTGTDPYLTCLMSTVYDSSGNNNGFLDPGETVDLTTIVKNIGGVDFTDLSTTIECTSSYITINDDTGYFGVLAVDSTKENIGDKYVVSASSGTPYNTEIDFSLITREDVFVDTLTFSLVVGLSAPNDTGYYYAYFSGGLHVHAPVFGWVAIDSTQVTHPGSSLDLGDNAVTQLALPFTFRYYGIDYDSITISSNGWIAMGYQTVDDQTNTAIPSPDGPQAMIAGIWDDLDPGNVGAASDIYFYYSASENLFIVEYFRVEHWPIGNEENFEIILYDPQHYPTPTGDGEIIVQYLNGMQEADNTVGIENASETIGVQYFLNGTYDPLGAPITDEFAIKYTTYSPDQSPGAEESRAQTRQVVNSLIIYPSITKGCVKIRYTIHDMSRYAAIEIYDVMGRFVRRFNHLTNSQSPITWNRKDYLGRNISKGIYFVSLETDGSVVMRKVILIE